ncbi:hypothetical protein DFJ74DRAFT_774440 [Hyaloraphidium curvatum]|nr:hypothetical protein DFJ74DRAFT_774440 [Hyaloraphidium curvatum]
MRDLPKPASFSAREWLALYPRPPSSRHPDSSRGYSSWYPPPPDAAAAARDADPLTQKSLFAALPPLLRGLTRAQFACWPFGRWLAPWFFGFMAVMLATLGTGWYFDDGTFDRARIAATFAGFLWVFVIYLIYPFVPSNRLAMNGDWESGDGGDLGAHFLAGLVRWTELASATDAEEGDNRELGSVSEEAGTQQFVKLTLLIASMAVMFFCIPWTLLFGIFAGQFWETWWCGGQVFLVRSILELPRRLGMRAANVAFASFFERYFLALDGGLSEAEIGELIGGRELYEDLHENAAAALPWGIGVLHAGGTNTLLCLAAFSVFALITASVGSCITLGALAPILWMLCWFAVDLSLLSLGNVAIEDLAGTYHDARQRIQGMLAAAARRADPAPQRVVDALRAHEALLGSFAGIERHRYRIFGFPVSFALLRTAVVTVVTLAVGLWSVLRGLGIFLTVQSYCPIR